MTSSNGQVWRGAIVVDLDTPTIDITGIDNHAVLPEGTTITPTFTCTDDAGEPGADVSGIASCTATLNDQPITAGEGINNLPVGSHELFVTARDNADNTTIATTTFSIRTPDTTKPDIEVGGVTNGATILDTETITPTFTCADPDTTNAITSGIGSCTATLNGQAIATGDVVDNLSVGSYELVVTARDIADNTTSATITFIVEASAGPRELTGIYAGAADVDGQVARLYMAVFARQPDQAGHQYWADLISSEQLTLTDVADLFITSTEFVNTYGDADNEAFAGLLYQNILVRTPDTEGFNFWVGHLDNGAKRSIILLGFSESTEFRNLTKTS